jgi:cell division protein FtsL
MAKRSIGVRGRWIFAAVLIGFVAVAAAVITRRSYGVAQAGEIKSLTARHAALESDRAQLEAAIREASSRARLMPVAERRLGMHVPDESHVIYLRRQTRSGGTP